MKKSILALVISVLGINSFAQQAFYDVTAANGNGVRFWQSDNFKIHMGNTAEYHFGPVTDYSIKMNMDATPGRGWTWGNTGTGTSVAALSNQGSMQIAGGFTVGGDIVLPSINGNKSIYTWSGGDANWRIGMSSAPGFTTSMATSHVEYLTYSNNTGAGFAVGVNGGQSSFEITGSNHNAFFRGSVGINTTSPIYGRFQVTQSSDASDQGIAILNVTGTRAMRIWTDANNSYVYSNGAGTSPLILNNGGNVGIGTTSPASKLHIDGGHIYLGPLSGSNPGIGRLSVSGITAEVSFSNRAISSFVESPTLGERWVIYNDGTATDGKLRFWSGGDKAVFTKEGNLGIGTTNPGSYKLAVEGKIGAREVNVIATNPWPDYVFEKNYKLPSLEEIKNYIDQNQHLPEVPSAKEVEKNGVNLGEMNALLLKKIEELTLYMIELKKENEGQHKLNALQQKEIEELKNKIK